MKLSFFSYIKGYNIYKTIKKQGDNKIILIFPNQDIEFNNRIINIIQKHFNDFNNKFCYIKTNNLSLADYINIQNKIVIGDDKFKNLLYYIMLNSNVFGRFSDQQFRIMSFDLIYQGVDFNSLIENSIFSEEYLLLNRLLNNI